MKAVKALYRPSFVILVLQFITVLCCWAKLMHVGFMPEQWVAWRVMAMLSGFIIVMAWMEIFDEAESLYAEIIVFLVPWVVYLVCFILCSVALWHPFTDMVTPDYFLITGGFSYALVTIRFFLTRDIDFRF